MSNHDDPNRPGHSAEGSEPGEAAIDDLATRAGSELRRSAPAGGLDQVRRSHQRRRTTNAVVAGAAVVVLAGGALFVATRGDSGDTIVTDTPTTSVDSSTVAPPSSVTATDPDPTQSTTVGTDTPETGPSAPGTNVASSEVVDPPVVVEPAVSDETLPDPLSIASDGFERNLVGRDLVVRTSPEQVIPLDLPETDLWLYGVGPDGVAYVRAEGGGLTRIVAVPTSGPTTGAVYELIAPYQHEGPWLGSMTPSGITTRDLTNETLVPYVDVDGRPLAQPDPTFTWGLTYSSVVGDPSMTRAVVVELATGAEFDVPDAEPTREGQFDSELRSLPDGRVSVGALREDGTAVVWALTPSTGLWTRHPGG